MGEPMSVNGGEVRFFYSIHTIPCIGFEVYYGGKSLYFSGIFLRIFLIKFIVKIKDKIYNSK